MPTLLLLGRNNKLLPVHVCRVFVQVVPLLLYHDLGDVLPGEELPGGQLYTCYCLCIGGRGVTCHVLGIGGW